jgi:AcrR family transcriptional regulator
MPTVRNAFTIDLRDEVAALKRARTVSAAVELFYENGYENTTLEAIGHSLGVTKPFIYAQFSSKVELLAEVCSRGIAASQEAMNSVLELDLRPREKLELLGIRFVTAVLDSRKHIAIFSREEKNLLPADLERINVMRRDFDHKLTQLLKAGMKSRDFAIDDPHLVALAIGGMVSWAYVWYRDNGRLSQAEVAQSMTRRILDMVNAKQ